MHGCQKLPIRSGTGCFIAVPIHGNSGRQRVNTFNYGRGYVSDIWRRVIEPVKVIMQFLIATLLLTGFLLYLLHNVERCNLRFGDLEVSTCRRFLYCVLIKTRRWCNLVPHAAGNNEVNSRQCRLLVEMCRIPASEIYRRLRTDKWRYYDIPYNSCWIFQICR